MVVGNGMIARAFAAYRAHPRVTIYAAGVSNSAETNPLAFRRERELLRYYARQSRQLVYFSSSSVAGPARSSAYVQHKQQMESLVAGAKAGHIVRLPQVVGPGANPHTLVEFLCRRITQHRRFLLFRGARRDLIDVADVVAIVDDLVRRNSLPDRVTIRSPRRIRVEEIVWMLEKLTGIDAVFDSVDIGVESCPEPDATDLAALVPGYRERFHPAYASDLLRKYYGDYGAGVANERWGAIRVAGNDVRPYWMLAAGRHNASATSPTAGMHHAGTHQ